jgi:hypothetical protein
MLKQIVSPPLTPSCTGRRNTARAAVVSGGIPVPAPARHPDPMSFLRERSGKWSPEKIIAFIGVLLPLGLAAVARAQR